MNDQFLSGYWKFIIHLKNLNLKVRIKRVDIWNKILFFYIYNHNYSKFIELRLDFICIESIY